MNGKHPLEARLAKWDETQLDFKLESYRRMFGAGEPIRRSMELQIAKDTHFAPQSLGGGRSLHQDILENRDHLIDWEEVYPGESGKLDFHNELERRMGV
jgi:proteasome maturation protein